MADEEVTYSDADGTTWSDEVILQIVIPDEDHPVVVRDAAKRELDVALVPFNTTISTRSGAEEFAPGSLAHLPHDSLFLLPPEHAGGQLGVDSMGQPTVKRPPAGRSIRIWEDDKRGYATFKVARTQQGDEIIALAEDGITTGVSIEADLGRSVIQTLTRAGRRISRITRAALTGAALTYRPAYGEQATVLAIRSQEVPMPESQEAPAQGLSQEATNALVAQMSAAFSEPIDRIMGRLERIEEEGRKPEALPATRTEDSPIPSVGDWAQVVLKLMNGERVSGEIMRQLDDVITGDNLGVVPEAHLIELIGTIDASRPFLSTTRRIDLPASGMTITAPIINQRPTVGIQSPEKEEVSSQKTLIGTETFSGVSIAGAADISIQLLRRSSPSFLGLFVELLAEAYAQFAEDVALDALANAMGGWSEGVALNPEDLNLGAAFVTSFDAIRRPPDTMWLSTQAIGEFIDAKASTTNQPLYPGLNASATAAGGITGTISGLRAVHVPTLDDHGAFAVVGPSSGFAWTEDGAITLQVDVPSKAGRDVGLVGILWPMPWYPAAFTLYNVAS